MAEDKKFTKEEMEKLEDIQKKYASIQLKLGQLGFTKIRLENEIQAVNESEAKLKEFDNILLKSKTYVIQILEILKI